MNDKFLEMEQVSVPLARVQIIEQLDLTIRCGEQWVITGPSGSGKTVLAHTLMGKHFYFGRIRYFFRGTGSEKLVAGTEPGGGLTGSEPGGAETRGKVSMVGQQHRFLNRAGTTELYYQQRFNSSDADQTITVEEELSGFRFRRSGGWKGADWGGKPGMAGQFAYHPASVKAPHTTFERRE